MKDVEIVVFNQFLLLSQLTSLITFDFSTSLSQVVNIPYSPSSCTLQTAALLGNEEGIDDCVFLPIIIKSV